jgi:energy-coupling factor transporter ATP-binding protein EcfA2
LQTAGHIDSYISINHFDDQFRKFTAVFSDPAAWTEKGHLFVVVGDRGFGKTSLIQRCAFWLRQEHDDEQCDVVVVDLSDERWEAETIVTRAARVRRWILRYLEDHLDADSILRISQLLAEDDYYFQLSLQLAARMVAGVRRPIVLAVLLPGYPSPTEIEHYYASAQRGIIFFAEVFDVGDTASISRKMVQFDRAGVDSCLLRLGTLKAGDVYLLAELITEGLPNTPVLQSTVLEQCDLLIRERQVGTAELMKLLTGMLRIAVAEGAAEVTVLHMVKYYADAVFDSTRSAVG